MDMIPVTIGCTAELAQIHALYEYSFPKAERREWSQVSALLQNGGPMEILELRTDGLFAGFLIGWQLPEFYFIEHFAIQPRLRGKKIGGTIIQMLQAKYPCIVLETEPAADNDSTRRIAFYEKLGFIQLPFTYFQPPYRTGESPLSMLLMRFPSGCNEDAFRSITETLNRCIYFIK